MENIQRHIAATKARKSCLDYWEISETRQIYHKYYPSFVVSTMVGVCLGANHVPLGNRELLHLAFKGDIPANVIASGH